MMLTSHLKQYILDKKMDEKLIDIYEDTSLLDYQRTRYIQAIEAFESLYGMQEVTIYSAPGRSEVGGNHTDHQHGKVIAASINLDCIAIVARREDGKIKIKSDEFDIQEIDTQDTNLVEKEIGSSEALVRGVSHGFKLKGFAVGGFNAYMTSDVLVGAGLSSSAAFETVVGTILSGLYNEMKVSAVEIAKVGQYAENEYFKKPCGLMDQMASSVGSIIHIDFINIQEPIITKLDVDFSSFHHSLCIVDTKGSHADLTPDYAAIPFEMKEVANVFKKDFLSEIDENEFYSQLGELRNKVSDRSILRAIHLFEENKRVDLEVIALKNNDFELFKKGVEASGNSSFKYLQNVYSNTDVRVQGVSLGLAMSEKVLGDKGVSRVHGGGFAGTIQAFVPNELVAVYKDTMNHLFGEGSCHVLKVRKYGGMKVF